MKTYVFFPLSAIVLVSSCRPTGSSPCPSPDDGDHYECNVAVANESLAFCALTPVPDGQPCRSGVGRCVAGECAMTSTTVNPMPNACVFPPEYPPGYSDRCDLSDECFSFSACIETFCARPGRSSCSYRPKPDGARCAKDQRCLAGLCCDAQPDRACTEDIECSSTDPCVVGTCADGACSLTWAKDGAACQTADDTAGRCQRPIADGTPECWPLN